MVGTVKFETRIKELVENLPDLAVLVEPLLIVRRVLREQFGIPSAADAEAAVTQAARLPCDDIAVLEIGQFRDIGCQRHLVIPEGRILGPRGWRFRRSFSVQYVIVKRGCPISPSH